MWPLNSCSSSPVLLSSWKVIERNRNKLRPAARHYRRFSKIDKVKKKVFLQKKTHKFLSEPWTLNLRFKSFLVVFLVFLEKLS